MEIDGNTYGNCILKPFEYLRVKGLIWFEFKLFSSWAVTAVTVPEYKRAFQY